MHNSVRLRVPLGAAHDVGQHMMCHTVTALKSDNATCGGRGGNGQNRVALFEKLYN